MDRPIEHPDDQQRSHELLERSRGALREEARDFAVENPGVSPVGLILNANASEARPFMEALEQAMGQRLDVPGFLGVVPRPFAVNILRANCPAALDNLPSGENGVTLPVLVATENGFRFGEVACSD